MSIYAKPLFSTATEDYEYIAHHISVEKVGSLLFCTLQFHDNVIKWKHFPRYWPCTRGIHRPPVNSPHKGQWRGALMFSLICAWTNTWAKNEDVGYLRRYNAHYDVIVMLSYILSHLRKIHLGITALFIIRTQYITSHAIYTYTYTNIYILYF